MALYYDLPLYKDCYRCVLDIFNITRHFPREYKYTLGQSMKNRSLTLVYSVYKANTEKDKENTLQEFINMLELLKIELRLACDLQLVPEAKLSGFRPLLASIGRQANGWRKQQSRQPVSGSGTGNARVLPGVDGI